MISIDTTEMCSHLQKKLFEEDGPYHRLWTAVQDDSELTAVVRSRQLHIYRNGKKYWCRLENPLRKLSGKTAFVRCYNPNILPYHGWKRESFSFLTDSE